MIYPHAMRLAGPWEYEVLRVDSGAPLLPAGRVKLPADWGETLGQDFRGLVRYVRRFNRPTNLDPHERVWLVIERVDARGRALLNNEPLGEIPSCERSVEFDLTSRLQLHNALVVEVECPAETAAHGLPRPGREHLPGGITGDVRLEIRSVAVSS